MDIDRFSGDLLADYPGDHNLEEADQNTLPTESVKDADSSGKVELGENEGAGEESIQDKVTTESDGVAMAEPDATKSKSSVSLVPYQDSSTTETEAKEPEEEPQSTQQQAAVSDGGSIQDDRRGTTSSSQCSNERPSSTSSAGSSVSIAGDQEVNDAIEELEAAMKEGTTTVAGDSDMKSSDVRALAKKGAKDGTDGGNKVVDEGAPPMTAAAEEESEGEGEEGEETAEDTLMIAVHVDEDAIDQESAELLDAECPNKGINIPYKAFKFSGHLCDHV